MDTVDTPRGKDGGADAEHALTTERALLKTEEASKAINSAINIEV